MLSVRIRGQALVNVLLVTLLFLGALFLAAGGRVFQMGVSSRTAAVTGAKRLAEATLQLAIARLIKDPTDPLGRLDMTLPSYNGGSCLLTTDPGLAEKNEIPISVNNLTGATTKPGWGGTVVAAETANLVACAKYRGATVKMEVVLNVPAFPYVVCSSVPLKSLGGLQIFGLASPDALKNGFANIAAEDKVPGHVATNAEDPKGGGTALELRELVNGAPSDIQGDAQSRGGITKDSGVKVRGELRPHAEMVPMPVIDFGQLDKVSNSDKNVIDSGGLNHPTLSGYNKCNDLHVTGGLQLDSGVLYVDGKLTVEGGLSGKGAIVSTGEVEIHGGGSLTGDNQSAIIAKKAVTIEGTADQPSEFRGLVYTEGNLQCKYTNIAGAVVVNNPDPTGSASLEKVALAQNSAATSMEFTVKKPGTTNEPLVWGSIDAFKDPTLTIQPMPQHQWTLIACQTRLDPTKLINPDYLKNPRPPGTKKYRVPDPLPDPWSLGVDGDVQWENPQGHSDLTADEWLAEEQKIPQNPDRMHHEHYHNPSEQKAIFLRMMADVSQYTNFQPIDADALAQSAVDATGPFYLTQLQKYVDALNAREAETTTGGSGGSSTWKFDLSQFFKMSERIRVLSWRQI